MDHEFIPNEPAPSYTEPADLIPTARKHFSRLGLIYLIGALLIIGIQSLALFIVEKINPALLESVNISLLCSMLPMYAIAIPLTALLLKKGVPATTIEKKKMTTGQWIVSFIICYAGMYISNFVGLILTQIIGLLKGSIVQNNIVDIVSTTNPWINMFIVVLLAPIFEELLFRKLLIDRTVKYGEGISILFSGLLFGLFHGNLNQFTYAFVLGLFFGFIYVKTGNIRYTILLHMLINFMGSVLGILLLNLLDYDALMTSMQDPATMVTYMTSHFPQLMIYMLYVLLLLGLVIAGIVLFIVNHKKMHLLPGEITLPKGKRFSTTILNLGMILYLVYWVVMIIMQLFQ